jgi:SPP1 gp7 family putative phage head morphogenesis protein
VKIINSQEYWKKREEKQLELYIKNEVDYDKKINRIYTDMLDGVQMQINSFYGKYATKEGITLAEAKKRVTELDIKAYERKAAKYVKDASLDRKVNGGKTNTNGYYFSEKANEEMRLYNLTMKVNRLEMLKANIGLELIKGHDELEKFMSDILQGRTEEELKRQAGILGKTVLNNAKTAHAIVNASFHNATFSDRIWMYQDLMKADLSKLLQTGLIQGKNPRVLARELKKTFNTSTYNAERLMRTELARVQTEAQKQSFERNGYDKYIFIVNAGCCGHCEEVANNDVGYGKGVYLVKDMMPGLNAPPLHPHDRCSTAAYSDRKEYEEWLDFLANGGTTEEYEQQKGGKIKNLDVPKKTVKQEKTQPQVSNTDFTKEQEAALEWYVSGEGQWVNQYLRGRGDFGEISESEKHLIKEIETATNRPLAANIKTLYRSVDASAIFGNMSDTDFENLENALIYGSSDKYATTAKQKYLSNIKGKTITEKGFMSTSTDYEVIADWGDFTGAEKPINIEFEVPEKTKGADLKKFDVEDDEQKEVLLAKDTTYEITEITAKDGHIYVKAKIKKN